MKAVTLTAPWSILTVATTPTVQLPLKRDETRSWRLTDGLPLRIAMHSGKGHAGLRDQMCSTQKRRFYEHQPYGAALRSLGYSDRDPWWKGWGELHEVGPDGTQYKPVPLASIIGLVTVVVCTRITPHNQDVWKQDPMNYALGNFDLSRWVWRLEDQVQLPEPIPCAGAQGIWTVPDAIVARIHAQGVK